MLTTFRRAREQSSSSSSTLKRIEESDDFESKYNDSAQESIPSSVEVIGHSGKKHSWVKGVECDNKEAYTVAFTPKVTLNVPPIGRSDTNANGNINRDEVEGIVRSVRQAVGCMQYALDALGKVLEKTLREVDELHRGVKKHCRKVNRLLRKINFVEGVIDKVTKKEKLREKNNSHLHFPPSDFTPSSPELSSSTNSSLFTPDSRTSLDRVTKREKPQENKNSYLLPSSDPTPKSPEPSSSINSSLFTPDSRTSLDRVTKREKPQENKNSHFPLPSPDPIPKSPEPSSSINLSLFTPDSRTSLDRVTKREKLQENKNSYLLPSSDPTPKSPEPSSSINSSLFTPDSRTSLDRVTKREKLEENKNSHLPLPSPDPTPKSPELSSGINSSLFTSDSHITTEVKCSNNSSNNELQRLPNSQYKCKSEHKDNSGASPERTLNSNCKYLIKYQITTLLNPNLECDYSPCSSVTSKDSSLKPLNGLKSKYSKPHPTTNSQPLCDDHAQVKLHITRTKSPLVANSQMTLVLKNTPNTRKLSQHLSTGPPLPINTRNQSPLNSQPESNCDQSNNSDCSIIIREMNGESASVSHPDSYLKPNVVDTSTCTSFESTSHATISLSSDPIPASPQSFFQSSFTQTISSLSSLNPTFSSSSHSNPSIHKGEYSSSNPEPMVHAVKNHLKSVPTHDKITQKSSLELSKKNRSSQTDCKKVHHTSNAEILLTLNSIPKKSVEQQSVQTVDEGISNISYTDSNIIQRKCIYSHSDSNKTKTTILDDCSQSNSISTQKFTENVQKSDPKISQTLHFDTEHISFETKNPLNSDSINVQMSDISRQWDTTNLEIDFGSLKCDFNSQKIETEPLLLPDKQNVIEFENKYFQTNTDSSQSNPKVNKFVNTPENSLKVPHSHSPIVNAKTESSLDVESPKNNSTQAISSSVNASEYPSPNIGLHNISDYKATSNDLSVTYQTSRADLQREIISGPIVPKILSPDVQLQDISERNITTENLFGNCVSPGLVTQEMSSMCCQNVSSDYSKLGFVSFPTIQTPNFNPQNLFLQQFYSPNFGPQGFVVTGYPSFVTSPNFASQNIYPTRIFGLQNNNPSTNIVSEDDLSSSITSRETNFPMNFVPQNIVSPTRIPSQDTNYTNLDSEDVSIPTSMTSYDTKSPTYIRSQYYDLSTSVASHDTNYSEDFTSEQSNPSRNIASQITNLPPNAVSQDTNIPKNIEDSKHGPKIVLEGNTHLTKFSPFIYNPPFSNLTPQNTVTPTAFAPDYITTGCAHSPGELVLGRELLKAAYEGRIMDVASLLSGGAKVNFVWGSKWTPLHRAAWGGHADVISLLACWGADVRARTVYGFTALHIAAYNDPSGDCVKQLIAAGADVDARNELGWTALHYAAESGRKVTVEALLNAGANKELRSNRGKTPYHVARTQGIKKILAPSDK